MVSYEAELSKQRVNKAFAEMIEKLEQHEEIARKNNYPTRTMSSVKLKVLRLGKHFDYSGNRKIGYQVDREMTEIEKGAAGAFGIDVRELVKLGLTNEKEIKKALIKSEYYELGKRGMKYKYIKEMLNKKYGVSISSIEKIIYK